MSEEKIKRDLPTIEQLVEHMKKYKDAVIIIGDNASKDLENGSVEAMSDENFTRKSWSKNNMVFWKYYFEKIYLDKDKKEVPKTYNSIKELEEKGLISKVICTNAHGLYENALNLKGVSNELRCSKCNELVVKTEEDLLSQERTKKSCPNCLSKIRPNCLMYLENYHPRDIQEMTNAIFTTDENNFTTPNTHTLILVGVDMTEDVIIELYDNLLLIRENTEDDVYMVMMTEDEHDVLSFTPEFATSSDIEASLERFKKLF